MATQIFFRNLDPSTHRGTNSTKLDGNASGWVLSGFATTRGSGNVTINVTTVAGTTNGIELGSSGTPYEFISEPLDADVTISGTITLNLWAAENNMNANAAINAIIERLDSQGGIVSTIAQTARVTELSSTVPPGAASNFTVTPTSTNMLKGDRLRVRIYADDAGTMASGFTVTFWYSGQTAAILGDSYLSFTETFGFLATAPTGSKLFLTDVAGPAVGANIEKEMWTSRGDGVNSIVRNTAAGWTSPLQWTDSGGGTAVEWYSKRLNAFTLSDLVRCNLRAKEDALSIRISVRAELATCNNDGTNVTVWGAGELYNATFGELTTSEAAYTIDIAGDDLSVAQGQRLRLRVFIDDTSVNPMLTSNSGTFYYDGTTADASGDSWIQLSQSVTEFSDTPDTTELLGRPFGLHGAQQMQQLLAQ